MWSRNASTFETNEDHLIEPIYGLMVQRKRNAIPRLRGMRICGQQLFVQTSNAYIQEGVRGLVGVSA